MHVWKDKMCWESAQFRERTTWKLAERFFWAKFTQGHGRKKATCWIPKAVSNPAKHVPCYALISFSSPHLQELISTYLKSSLYVWCVWVFFPKCFSATRNLSICSKGAWLPSTVWESCVLAFGRIGRKISLSPFSHSWIFISLASTSWLRCPEGH